MLETPNSESFGPEPSKVGDIIQNIGADTDPTALVAPPDAARAQATTDTDLASELAGYRNAVDEAATAPIEVVTSPEAQRKLDELKAAAVDTVIDQQNQDDILGRIREN